jgi:hypothetical protein
LPTKMDVKAEMWQIKAEKLKHSLKPHFCT